jgi:uncharacterized DUF497 family protein
LSPILNLSFEWDEAKNLANVEKHDLDFDDVIVVFKDPGAFDYKTVRNGESRSVRVGGMGDRVIAVVFVVRGEITRLISARYARRIERQLYEANRERK